MKPARLHMLYVFLLTCTDGAQRLDTYHVLPIILTNKSVLLIHYVTICKQKTMDIP